MAWYVAAISSSLFGKQTGLGPTLRARSRVRRPCRISKSWKPQRPCEGLGCRVVACRRYFTERLSAIGQGPAARSELRDIDGSRLYDGISHEPAARPLHLLLLCRPGGLLEKCGADRQQGNRCRG